VEINVDKGATGLTGWGRHFHIASLLRDSSLTQTLKDLIIGVKSLLNVPLDTQWQDLYNSKIWKDLDLILSPVSTFQRMVIHLDFPYLLPESIPAQFLAGMRESMPLLEERGILTFKLNHDNESRLNAYPERDVWTDA
jgi:hypothetical protein